MTEMKKPKNQQEKETMKSSTTKLIKEITRAEEIIGAIGDGISILDRTFKIIYQNQIEKDMMGDHVGEKCYKAYAKRQGICSGCPVALTFKDRKVHTVQREIQTDEGTRYAEITASPLKDSKGKIIAGIEVMRDITERKLAEEALKENEQRYRNVYKTAPLAFVLWDRETRVTDWNNHAEQMFGWTREEIVGQNFFDYIIPESARIHVQKIVKLLLEGKLPSYSINENITKSGRIIVCEWNNSITMNSGGNVIGVISLGLDITERKRAEEELKMSEEKFRTLFEQAGDYAMILSPSAQAGLVIIDANEAACRMHGFTRDEFIGMPVSKLDPELSNEHIRERTQRLLSGEPLKFETIHYRKDGTSFPLEVCTKAVEIAGSPLLVFSTERDITDRKQAEKEINKKVKELEEFYDMAVGRELRMKQLKKENDELKEALKKYENL